MSILNLYIFNGPGRGAVYGREVDGKGEHFILHFLTRQIDEMRNRRR